MRFEIVLCCAVLSGVARAASAEAAVSLLRREVPEIVTKNAAQHYEGSEQHKDRQKQHQQKIEREAVWAERIERHNRSSSAAHGGGSVSAWPPKPIDLPKYAGWSGVSMEDLILPSAYAEGEVMAKRYQLLYEKVFDELATTEEGKGLHKPEFTDDAASQAKQLREAVEKLMEKLDKKKETLPAEAKGAGCSIHLIFSGGAKSALIPGALIQVQLKDSVVYVPNLVGFATGKGAGAAALKYALDIFDTATGIELFSLQKAIGFYAKLGFNTVKDYEVVREMKFNGDAKAFKAKNT